MHKAATWNINGVGFDAREAAREAARRAGVSVGEWLQDVIADRAAERGVAAGDVGEAERIEAVTERLERLEAGLPFGGGRDTAFERDTSYTDEGRDRGRRTAPRERFREQHREGSRARREAPTEALLDEAIEAMERRASRTERRTDKALARFAQMIETTDTRRDDERDMFAALSHKLSDMETRIAERVAGDNPIKVALARLEERLEAMGRPATPVPSTPVSPAPAAPTATPDIPVARGEAPIERLEAKLNSILEAITAKPTAPMQTSALAAARARSEPLPEAPIAAPAFANRRLGEAIAEIATHQRALERQEAERRAGPPRLSIPLPPRRAPVPDPVAAGLHGDIAGLTAKIEEMRREMAAGTARARGDVAAPLDDLRAEVAGMSRMMREIAPRQSPGKDVAAALDEMRRDIARRDEAKLAAVASRADLDALRADIGGLSRSLGQLAPRGSVTAIEEAIRALTAQMEATRESQTRGDHARDALMRPFDDVLGSLRDSLADIDPRDAIGGMEREVRTINAKLGDMAGVDAPTLARIQAQTSEIRDLLTAASADPLAVERIEHQVAGLTRKLEQQAHAALDGESFRAAADEIRALVENAPGLALLDKVEQRLEALTAKVDQAVDAASGARRLAELSKQRFDDVQDQLAARLREDGALAAVPEAPADLRSLEHLVRDLAARMEAAQAPDASNAALDALQQQILQLSQRFERTDSELSTLAAIERSMHELFAHLEDTRANVEASAAQAARETANATLAQRGAHDPAALREIATLKAIQGEADQRTHRTLNAVHETLEKVVDRLSQMESEVASVRTPRPVAPRPTSLRTAPLPDLMLDPADALDRPLAPHAAPERARAPSYAPSRAAPTDLDETAGRADFIAAARRAAQTAQADPAVLAAKAGHAVHAPSEARAGLMAKSRDYVANHKKPVLLSVAALFVTLGALAVVDFAKRDEDIGRRLAQNAPASQPARIAAVQPTAAARPLAADLTPSALPNAPAPTNAALPGSDPITTGSLPRIPSFAAQSIANAGPAAPTGSLKQMADEGDAAAQYEVASRYAEGRRMVKDFKLAADWYEKAAQQGSAPAQYKLAALYEKGLGVPKDKAKARAWYTKAADAGNPRAMHNLAVLVADGDGKPDYAGAVAWFRKAADYGVHDSQYNLAILLARGLGVPQSLVQSYQWFAVAAQENDADAATKRDQVGAKLSPSDLAVAKTLASTFHPKTANLAAVQIDPPAGGWDGASAPSSLKSTRAKLSSL